MTRFRNSTVRSLPNAAARLVPLKRASLPAAFGLGMVDGITSPWKLDKRLVQPPRCAAGGCNSVDEFKI